MDPIEQFKQNAKLMWSGFAAAEMMTASAAPSLVAFAGVRPGVRLLDVGCGTGVVALTAARLGARVTGADLTPVLLERARESAALMGLEAAFREADVEALPFSDGEFDFVLSQFGHMFAPRPDVALREMLRVLKPGGTIAFSTWPPELYVGRLFAINGKYGPPPPPGMPPATDWGMPEIVRERLGSAVTGLCFSRDVMRVQTLSVQHLRLFGEANFGPLAKVVALLRASDETKLASFRREVDELAAQYFKDNHVEQSFLLTRATKT